MRFVNRSVSYVLIINIIMQCTLLSGCGGNDATIWSAESKSPNGDWVARAQTLQSSGFGTSAVATGVYLDKAADSMSTIQVLGFSNNAAYPLGVTSVKMTWITDSHLDVTYNAGATLNFKLIKTDDVEITVHQVKS